MVKLLLGWLSRNGTRILGWLFSSALFKFLLFSLIYLAITELLPILIDVFIGDKFDDVRSLLSDIPDQVAYFLRMFRIDLAFKMVFSAYAVRFLIRRIPVVG